MADYNFSRLAYHLRTSILATRIFRDNFLQCLSRHPISLRAVSPYIGKIPGFGTIVDFARYFLSLGSIYFQLITCPPDSNSETITSVQAEALILFGVELLIRTKPQLHSKIYQFEFKEGDMSSFVGSANFTRGGFERNDETVAFFRHKNENDKVKAELDRLAGKGSLPFQNWKVLKDRS